MKACSWQTHNDCNLGAGMSPAPFFILKAGGIGASSQNVLQ